MKFSRTAASIVIAGVIGCALASQPAQAQRRKVKPPSAQTLNLNLVAAFEKAYHNKDKKTMINKLMVPTTDGGALEKRYQWLRGYGPTDMPGSVHPPILFETSKGSFVPAAYKVTKTKVLDAGHYDITVHEQGRYKDEDGWWKVDRDRHFKTTFYKGKWYVVDYYLDDNADDYGFFVDDIRDKVVKVDK